MQIVFLQPIWLVFDLITSSMTLKHIMKEIMSPHRAQSEESLQGLNLGMFGMLYNLYSDLYGVLTVEIRCVPSCVNKLSVLHF